jgi:hypothetical protein
MPATTTMWHVPLSSLQIIDFLVFMEKLKAETDEKTIESLIGVKRRVITDELT